eukprot:2419125-Rhodomonas_salina.1
MFDSLPPDPESGEKKPDALDRFMLQSTVNTCGPAQDHSAFANSVFKAPGANKKKHRQTIMTPPRNDTRQQPNPPDKSILAGNLLAPLKRDDKHQSTHNITKQTALNMLFNGTGATDFRPATAVPAKRPAKGSHVHAVNWQPSGYFR